jgi:predicted nucleotidyltransferase
MTLDEVLITIERNKDAVRAFGVKKLGVFGSVVRGEATENSDLDFLVQLEKETFRAYMGLCFFLEDLFKRKVDLVLIGSIKERLRDRILEEVHYVEGF